jgi:hypothetical protein
MRWTGFVGAINLHWLSLKPSLLPLRASFRHTPGQAATPLYSCRFLPLGSCLASPVSNIATPVRAAWTIPPELAAQNGQPGEQRRDMMQRWGDYLDSLKNGADVVPRHRRLA